MEATFNFHISANDYNKDKGSVVINFEGQEVEVYDDYGAEMIRFYVSRDLKELKRLNNTLNSLIREME